MNDNLFQKWSDTLSTIRQSRLASLVNLQKEKGRNFSPKDLVEVAKMSLEDAIGRWWGFEQESMESSSPPEDQEMLSSEMESVIDFEMDAIQRDLDSFQQQVGWNPKTLNDEMSRLQTFSDKLKKNYQQKIRSLKSEAEEEPSQSVPSFSPFESKSPSELTPSAPVTSAPSLSPSQPIPRSPRRAGGKSSGSGVVMFLMLIVGLLIGTGPSIYFWDQAGKTDVTTREKISQLQSEKRALEDNIAVFQKNYSDLARGKKKTLPQLEEAIRPIREEIASRRGKIEREYKEKQENLIKKTPAGDRFDRAAKRLKDNRDEHLEALEAEEKTRLEPYLKQMQLLKELMGT